MEPETPAPLQRSGDELRLEDDVLVRGAGRYVDDITLPGMVHAFVVRSTHAHARILAIDSAEARAMPGVVCILTAQDLTGIGNVIPPIPRDDMVYDNAPGHPVLADGKVSYVGQPVAVVVAEELSAARDAADRVAVRYDPLPVFLDARAAAADGADRVHDFIDSNVAFRHRTGGGDIDAAFAAADRIVRTSYDVPRVVATPMECRGVVAQYLAEEQR